MLGIRKLIVRWFQCEYAALTLLVLIVAALHFATILQPPSPVFDEKFYVPSARHILEGQGTTRLEHPPLGQLIIASGIRIFGDNPFGWRIFPVIFGLAGIVLFYLICRRLGLDRKYAYLATFLLAFENLSFVQSSLAMLDVFSLTFMLAAFWFYLHGRYAGSGAMVALGMLAKLTGVLAIPIIAVHWLFTDRKRWRSLVLFLVTTAVAFWALMPLLDFLVWRHWQNPFSQVKFMLQANSAATFGRHVGDPMLSRPWDWLIHPEILTYWIDPHYVSMISPPLWALIIPAVIFLIFKAWKYSLAALFAIIWFAGTYLVWVPVSLFTDRMSYIYYIYPAIGAVCIALSLMVAELDRLARRRQIRNLRMELNRKRLFGMIVPLYYLICLLAFAILSPVSYWWKFPLCAAAYLLTRYYIGTATLDSERNEKETFQGGVALKG